MIIDVKIPKWHYKLSNGKYDVGNPLVSVYAAEPVYHEVEVVINITLYI